MSSISLRNLCQWLRAEKGSDAMDCRSERAAVDGNVAAPLILTVQASAVSPNPPVCVSAAVEESKAAPPLDLTELPKEDPLAPVPFEMHRGEFLNLITQDTFDGFRMEASKSVTPQLQASQTLMLGTTLRAGGYMYQFGPTFTSEDGTLFVFSRLGTDGVTNGRIVKRFPHAPKAITSLTPGQQPKRQFSEVKANFSSSLTDDTSNIYEFGYSTTGEDWTSSLAAVWQGTWFLNGSFSQVVAPRLQLGADLTWIVAHGGSNASIGARYVHKNNFWSGQLTRSNMMNSAHGARVQYLRKINDRLSLGTELDICTDMSSALKMGYEYSFRSVGRVQGSVDTGGKVSVFCQNNNGFGISGYTDFWKGVYKFGFIMHVAPQPEGPPPE